MSLLILDDNADAKIKALVEHAEKNIFTVEEIAKIMDGSAPPAGDREGFSIFLPVHYKAVYTIEEHKAKMVVRHLSLSVNKEGRLPHPAVVEELLQKFGFVGPLKKCVVYMEGPEEDPYAVNIIEEF